MIVAVGMLTILLWKVFITITDRREFAQFEQESKNMKFNIPTHTVIYLCDPQVSIVIDHCQHEYKILRQVGRIET